MIAPEAERIRALLEAGDRAEERERLRSVAAQAVTVAQIPKLAAIADAVARMVGTEAGFAHGQYRGPAGAHQRLRTNAEALRNVATLASEVAAAMEEQHAAGEGEAP
jgi:hypothetical protein